MCSRSASLSLSCTRTPHRRTADRSTTSWAAAAQSLNALIALSRLGHHTQFVSAVGKDVFGELVLDTLRAEQVGAELVETDATRPTGLYFKERRTGSARQVVYYRQNSAASAVGSQVVEQVQRQRPRIVLVSGLNLGLGGAEGLAGAVRAVLAGKAAGGYQVVFDANLRRGIWDGDVAASEFAGLLGFIDVLVAGEDELARLLKMPPLPAARAALGHGVSTVFVKRGAAGSVVVDNTGERVVKADAAASVVDTVGAGDAYTAGVVSGLLRGWEPLRAGRLGSVLGASVVSRPGDWEGLPDAAAMTTIAADVVSVDVVAAALKDAPEPVPTFYRAYLAGDSEQMTTLLHERVQARFSGHATLLGRIETAEFLRFGSGLFSSLDFTIVEVLSDDDGAAVVWDETGLTSDGRPWHAHGVDVIKVQDGLIIELDVVNDARQVRALLPPYRGPGGDAPRPAVLPAPSPPYLEGRNSS